MANIFSEIEEEIFFNEEIIFDEVKIKENVISFIDNKISLKNEKERPFYFQEIVYDFFDYMNIPLLKAKKTRDFGVDGIVRLNIGFLGSIDVGLQIKYTIVDSNDVDLFLSALRNSELQLGVIVCKDSRELTKYELNTKLKAILFSKGIVVKERLIKDKVDINPVFVLKFQDLIDIVTSQIRAVVKGVYKK